MSLSTWVAIFSVVLAAFSFSVAGVAFWRTSQVSEVQINAQHFLWLSSAFLEHPYLRPYFYDPRSDLSELEGERLQRAMVIAEEIADVFDINRRLKWRPLRSSSTRPWFEDWELDILARSELLRRYVLDNERWYGSELVSAVRRAQVGPAIPGDRTTW